ncbi:MAG: hypothetical protein ABIG93_03685 [archaeon]|nr:hypothetical protein [Nanoarchaeota archaeon]
MNSINEDLAIPHWETHWYQLKDTFLFELKDDLLEKLILKGIKKAGNLSLLCNELNLSSPTFYNLINNKGVNMVSVMKLKKLLDYLGINYNYMNDKILMTKKGKVISIKNPKFPINLNNEDGAYLLGLIVSDGCIFKDKKARNKFRTKYAAGEEQSAENFIKIINKLFGEVHIQKEFVRNCILLRIGSSIIGESLLRVGAISGRKATVDGEVPWLIKKGTKEMKANYLKAAFDDESSVYKDKKGNYGYITLSRYRHLNNLTKKQIKELELLDKFMLINKFPTGHITKVITIKKASGLIEDKKLLSELNKAPKLLQGESKILKELDIKNRIFAGRLSRTHAGRYSLCFDLHIARKGSLTKFYKYIGYSLDRKQNKLINLVVG